MFLHVHHVADVFTLYEAIAIDALAPFIVKSTEQTGRKIKEVKTAFFVRKTHSHNRAVHLLA